MRMERSGQDPHTQKGKEKVTDEGWGEREGAKLG